MTRYATSPRRTSVLWILAAIIGFILFAIGMGLKFTN